MKHSYHQTSLARGSFRNSSWDGFFLAAMLLASFLGGLPVQAQECGTVWTEGSIPPYHGGGVYAFSTGYNGTRFVACGVDYDVSDPAIPRIWTSDNDGVTWTNRDANMSEYQNLWDVASDGSQFVVVGFSGKIITSPEGINWTERNSGLSGLAFRTVIWDGSQFIAGTGNGGGQNNSGYISRSPDGVTWTPTGKISHRVEDIAYNGVGLYVCHEYYVDASIYTSTNAVSWTKRATIAGGQLMSVAYGAGTFVIAGQDRNTPFKTLLLRSSDGINWTRSAVPATFAAGIGGVTFNGSVFITTCINDGVGDYALTSPDAITWTKRPMTLPWTITFHNIASAITGSKVITMMAGDGGGPRVFVNECYPVPAIIEQPQAVLPCNNGSAQFCVTATGVPPLSYQWERDIGGGWGNISGAQSDCGTISPVSTSDEGDYRCRVWNNEGTVTSNSASLTVRFPPSTFSEQPQDQMGVCEFNEAQFCVTVTDGTPPLNYQWERDTGGGWGNAPNGDASCYTIDSVDPADAGQYRCRVWDDCGTTTSNEATLTVIARAKPDFDCDDDVDQDDFGHFQRCLSGSGIEQDDPACADARLDGDTDVDADDFAKFLNCLSGPGTQAVDSCADLP